MQATNIENFKEDYPFKGWMHDNEIVQNLSIKELSLVGSHDSFAYITQKNTLVFPLSVVPNPIHGFIKKWSLTQKLSLYQQCKAEVIIIDINHLYDIHTKQAKMMFDLIWEKCGEHLVVSDQKKLDVPIKKLIEMKQRLFLFCLDTNCGLPRYVWHRQFLESYWPAKNTTKKMMKKLPINAEKALQKDIITVVQAVVTPTLGSIQKSTYLSKFPSSTLKIAKQTNPIVLDWLETNPTFINIILVDRIKKNDAFVQEMIKRSVVTALSKTNKSGNL
ncbi:Phosphatidylinositol-specific phospholipase C X domain containing protein [Entamoeba marina]